MSYLPDLDFFQEVSEGKNSTHEAWQSFGRNDAVGTSQEVISIGNVYLTPQVSSATTVRIASGGSVHDTAAGAGAREVTVQGLLDTGAIDEEAIATAGASASAATTKQFIRTLRAYVSASGSYAGALSSSHAADIVIENSAGTADLLTILHDGLGRGQSLVGAYSVPLGKKLIVHSLSYGISSTKVAHLQLYKRENILETAAPYTAKQLQWEQNGLEGSDTIYFPVPLYFPALSDVIPSGRVSTGTGDISIALNGTLSEA